MVGTTTAPADDPVRDRARGRQDRLRAAGLADWPRDCALRRVDTCPVCETPAEDWIGSNDRYGWATPVYRCGVCDLVYLGTTWTPEGAERFYAQHYRPLVNAWHDKPANYTWQQETQDYRERCRIYWPIVKRSQWCDVGGDEVNPEHGTGLLETFTPTRTYELVTCCQTFDHLLNPRAAMKALAKMVTMGGHLWIDYVNFDKTHEIKADHPLNWTLSPLMHLLDWRDWRLIRLVDVDDRHVGILLERRCTSLL